MLTALQKFEKQQLKSDIPEFRPGDTLRVHLRITEGEKSRVQIYEGVCIGRAGTDIRASFTVRRVSYGVGMERIFPLHLPAIEQIEVVRRGKVRRTKLYYLRELRGKKARITEIKTPYAPPAAAGEDVEMLADHSDEEQAAAAESAPDSAPAAEESKPE